MSLRFGIVPDARSGKEWVAAVRAAEERGYDTVLAPDTLFTPSPFPLLAAAAAVTSDIRLRTNVVAAPLRSAAETVRETAALRLLSDGRFELGIGSGRPQAEQEAQRLGRPWPSAARRRDQVIEVIGAVRSQVDPAPPIVVAAAGPRMLAVAAAHADRVLLAAAPSATESELADLIATARAHTDRPLPCTLQIAGIGDRLPYWLRHHLGHTPADLRARGAAALLPSDPRAALDTLLRRRETHGIDEVVVPGELADAFDPILSAARAAGHR
ncbi:LLM class flavin-dependent oxidoreductase [Nocardia thailandica]|uniref:LLM class flavin-dependent oxidoreductase n=1 Tax=Nocardia thailandica TaxID=257275 RepID=UPI00031428C3|nr:LLM class flavin-dependent oxidoreductase [Nocardia thailandica]